MKLKRKHILPILGVIFILIQFFRIDKTNPPVDSSLDFISTMKPPTAIAENIKVACYDCHSHESKYPWYTNVAPVSWWIKGHIDNGRKHLNFSNWAEYKKGKQEHKLEESIDMVEKNWMPLFTYKWLHPESKMTDDERAEMIAYFKSIM